MLLSVNCEYEYIEDSWLKELSILPVDLKFIGCVNGTMTECEIAYIGESWFRLTNKRAIIIVNGMNVNHFGSKYFDRRDDK